MKKNTHLIKRNPKEKDLFFSKRVENGKFVEIDRPVFNMHVHRYNHQKPKKYEQTNLFEQPEMKK